MSTPFQASARWLRPDEARRQVRAWAIRPLAIRRAGALAGLLQPGGPLTRIPLLQVEPRPDVADLIRRHQPQLDGDGEATYRWRFCMAPGAPSLAALRCDFREPARCTFSILFDLREHAAFLQQAAATNMMAITTDDEAHRANVLALENCAEELTEPLALFALGELLHARHR